MTPTSSDPGPDGGRESAALPAGALPPVSAPASGAPETAVVALAADQLAPGVAEFDCPHCGYPHRGLRSRVCPECAYCITDDDIEHSVRRLMWLEITALGAVRRPIVVVVLTIALVLIARAFSGGTTGRSELHIFAVVVSAVFVIGGVAVGGALTRLFRFGGALRGRVVRRATWRMVHWLSLVWIVPLALAACKPLFEYVVGAWPWAGGRSSLIDTVASILFSMGPAASGVLLAGVCAWLSWRRSARHARITLSGPEMLRLRVLVYSALGPWLVLVSGAGVASLLPHFLNAMR